MRPEEPAKLLLSVGIATCLVAASLAITSCGDGATEVNEPTSSPTTDPAPLMSISSAAFEQGGEIPAEHAREGAGGQNVSPPLGFSGVPEGARSMALLCIDKHAIADKWVHWMVVDLPADTTSLAAGASGASMPAGSRELLNGFGVSGWGGPEPPPGSGSHEYAFTLYALDTESLDLPDDASLADFEAAVAGHEVAAALLSGTFER